MPVEQARQNILVVGHGSREHALAWKLWQGSNANLFITTGNPGTDRLAKPLPVKPTDIDGIRREVRNNRINFVVVGPEAPLAAGLVDALQEDKVDAFGPTKKAAQLESSKWFAYQMMKRAGIPCPDSRYFTEAQNAYEFLDKIDPFSIVVKADGLAYGKGVVLPKTRQEALDAVFQMMEKGIFGDAGRSIVIQKRLRGREVSAKAFTDGTTVIPLLESRDYKNLKGKNTGGMGAYAPLPDVDESLQQKIFQRILQPTVRQMHDAGIPYKGVLYAGLMIDDKNDPYVLEFNCRMGDPETQPLMMLLQGDLLPALQATARGSLRPEHVSFHEGAAVCVVLASKGYPDNPVTGDEIMGLKKAESRHETVIFQAGTKKEGNKLVTDGGRVLSVTSYGQTLPEARTRAYDASFHIRFQGMQQIYEVAL